MELQGEPIGWTCKRCVFPLFLHPLPPGKLKATCPETQRSCCSSEAPGDGHRTDRNAPGSVSQMIRQSLPASCHLCRCSVLVEEAVLSPALDPSLPIHQPASTPVRAHLESRRPDRVHTHPVGSFVPSTWSCLGCGSPSLRRFPVAFTCCVAADRHPGLWRDGTTPQAAAQIPGLLPTSSGTLAILNRLEKLGFRMGYLQSERRQSVLLLQGTPCLSAPAPATHPMTGHSSAVKH